MSRRRIVQDRPRSGASSSRRPGRLGTLRHSGPAATLGLLMATTAAPWSDAQASESGEVERPDDDPRHLSQLPGDLATARLATGPATPVRLGDAELARLEVWVERVYPRAPGVAAVVVDRLLPRLSGLERTQLICSWATSPSAALRQTLAMALPLTPHAVGVDEAAELLRRDPADGPRRAADRAAARLQALQLASRPLDAV